MAGKNPMINFRDFTPAMTDSGGLFKAPTIEEFHQALARANEWVAENKINVINLETVVLPNIYMPGEKGSSDTQLRTSGEMYSYWHQFIRVWYQVHSG